MPLARYRKMPSRRSARLRRRSYSLPIQGERGPPKQSHTGGQSERIGETKEVKSAHTLPPALWPGISKPKFMTVPAF